MTRSPSLATLAFAAALTAFTFACGEVPVAAFRMQEIVPPPGGDALTLTVTNEGRVIALSETHVYVWDASDGGWEGRRASELEGAADRTPPFGSVLVDGHNHNYPRTRLLTSWNGAIWLMTRQRDEPMLLVSTTEGATWTRVALPRAVGGSGDADDDEGEEEAEPPAIPEAVRATEPLRIVGSDAGLFLVSTNDVFRLEGNADDPQWSSIGIDGLPKDAAGLPPAIRNYLPRAEHRPFELVTVLAEQLMVFRRTERDEAWVMVSTLTTVDRELRGVPGADTVFLIAPDAIRRSDDHGEGWFRFWPEGNPTVESTLVVPHEDADAGYLLIAGGANGSIWRTLDGGARWEETRRADPDSRAISGLALADSTLWATTMGEGALQSEDFGATWVPHNDGLRAARPLRVAFTAAGDLLYASRAGLHQLAGPPDSGSWTQLHERASTALHVETRSGRIVVGTASGDIVTQSVDAGAVHIPNPFENRSAFEFAPPGLTRDLIGAHAVVGVASRDDGQRWMAWSHRHGAASSEDGGISWKPLNLSDALMGALGSTTVTQFAVDAAETIYLVEESPDSRSPALLWRSNDNGLSWTTVHAFERSQPGSVLVKPRPPNYPGVLFAAHGSVFQRSTDYGETWEVLDGPWSTHRVVNFSIDENQAALLVDTRRHFEVVTFDDIDAAAPSTTRSIMVFPPDVRPDSTDVTQFALSERRIIVTSRDRAWIGRLPTRRGGIPDGMTMVATLSAAIVLIAIAFLLLRRSVLS